MVCKKCIINAILVLFILVQIPGCKKDDATKPATPENPKYNIATPEFISTDSVIVIGLERSTYIIKILTNDTLEYFYTTDGSIPDKNGLEYDSVAGIGIALDTTTIKVIAYHGDDSSEVLEKWFYVTHLLPLIVSGIVNKTNYSSPVTISISDLKNNVQYVSTLNSEPIDLLNPVTVSNPNFYELKIISRLGGYERSDSFMFVILDSDMNETMWGLRTWVPEPYIESQIMNESVDAIYPLSFPLGLNLPVILKILYGEAIKPLYLSVSNSYNSNLFKIKRGIGSINLMFNNDVNNINFTCGNKQISLPVDAEITTWSLLSGTTGNYKTGKNARIRVTGNLTVSSGDTLLIEEGSVLAVDEAVDINNFGFIKIDGTEDNPVVITCFNPDAYWGGFLSKGTGNKMEVTNAILCQSGYHTSTAYNWGHAQRQALFYLENTEFNISDSYMIDHIGQVFYSLNSDLQINNILVQRAKTSGQLNTSQVVIDNSIFTDFPNDSYIFRDEDNDALYVNHCDATISYSTFMFAKDDGIDSGGDEGGAVNINNCRFEANFHEGIALSSKNPAVRTHNISNCVVTNCGQGIELGFSSATHTVNITNCLIYKNGIGLRYGDNYDWNIIDGTMNITETRSVNNIDKDVWNMLRPLWSAKIDHMHFTYSYISKPSAQYPELPVITDFNDYPE